MYTIGIVYNKPRDLTDEEKILDPRSYKQPEIIAKSVEEAFISKGHKVTMIPASLNLLQDVENAGELDVIYNCCTGLNNKNEQANIVAMLELTEIPIVGSNSLAHTTALHKGTAKAVFQAAGVPVTPFQVFNTPNDPLDDDLSYPLFVKPESEGSALGITMDSIVDNEDKLRKRVKYVIDNFNQPALVEGYLSGREFSVGVVGTKNPKTLPIIEVTFPEDSENKIQSVTVKELNDVGRTCPAKVAPKLEKQITDTVLKAYNALDCSEYARVDVKLDDNDIPNIIELNTLPAIERGHSHFEIMAVAAGYTMADLVETLVDEKMESLKDKRYKKVG